MTGFACVMEQVPLAEAAAPRPVAERELCRRCEGNGVIKIPGGVSVCPRCHQDCYEPTPPPPPAEAREDGLQAIQRRYGCNTAGAMEIQTLRAKAQALEGAARADEARLRAAAERVGVLWVGCDTPEALADKVQALEQERDAARADLFIAKTGARDVANGPQATRAGLDRAIAVVEDFQQPGRDGTDEWVLQSDVLAALRAEREKEHPHD